MMRNTARLLAAALLSLIAGPAFAQCTSMPANSVCGRLAIPAGGGSAVAIPFSAFAPALAPNFNWIRLSGIQNPTTGFGLELGYDGTEGSIQSYSNRASLTLSPIFYTAASHKFTGGFSVAPAPQTAPGSRVFSISSTENGAVSGAPGPIQLTWGASAGSVWDASPSGGNIGGNANLVTTTMFAKQDTFDVVPWQTTAHLSAGTGAAIVGTRVQTYIDSTTTTPRGGTGLEVLMRNDATGGDIWGTNVGASYHGTTTTGALHGTEYDIEALGATVKYKFGMVIGSTQLDVATVTGTLAVNGTADTVPGSAAYWVTAFGGGGAGSAIGFDSGILTMKETGGGTPVTGRLWYAGGFSVPVGLDWGRMTFSSAAINLPNNAPIKAYNAAGTTLLPILNLNSSNVIAIGAGATVDQTSGSASFGVSTMIALAINGTLGNGYLELGNQSSAPSTPAANKARLFSNSAGAFSFKSSNGFVTTLNATGNTADRGYTLPDGSGTLAFGPVRTVLQGSGTYFVNCSTGNDSNTGLSSGAAFLTLQKAANVVYNGLDLNGFGVNVSVSNNACSAGFAITNPQVGMGTVTFQGNVVTPSSVTITSTGADAIRVINGAAVTVAGFKLVTVTSGNHINADAGAQVTTGAMEFGASAGDHMVASHGAVIYDSGNSTISGSASAHWHAGNQAHVQVGGTTVTCTGSPAFAAEFAGVSTNASIFVLTGTNFSGCGTATGQRFLAHTGGFINTTPVSSSLTFLPGNVAGSADTDGSYNDQIYTTGMDVQAVVRSTGATAQATGTGLEIGWDGTQGFIQAFDRAGSAFKPILYNALTSHTFKLGGTTAFTISGSNISAPNGINFGGSTLSNYVTATSWTPADGSGASLAFTGVSASYTRVGNMVFAYALLTYPATGSGASAIISGFPIATPNANYAQNPCTFFSGASVTNSYSMRMNPNATTAPIFNNAGAATTNAQLSGSVVIFSCAYPAT